MVRLFYLQTHFADGRLIRVTGEDGKKKAIRLLRDQVFGEYDTEVDKVPTSPNQKEQNWLIIREFLPIIKEDLTPEEFVTLLEYSPLPSRLVSMLKRKLEEPPSPDEIEAQNLMKEEKRADIAAKAAKAKRDESAAMRDKLGAILDVVDKAVMANQARLAEAQSLAQQQQVSMTPDEILRRLALMQPEPMPMQQGAPPLPPQPGALPFFGSGVTIDAESAPVSPAALQPTQGGLE